uniref:Uncharacterized protein n=1 Tax=Caulobacter phage BL57 TaxID=3348355 RepID=A0AB74UGK1_9VIRU
MTTAVDIRAAGHNIIVTLADTILKDGVETEVETYEFVKAGETRTFHVHQARDLFVTEVRDDETELNALIAANDTAGARQFITDSDL